MFWQDPQIAHQKQGQSSSQVPIGLSSLINWVYGRRLAGRWRSHVFCVAAAAAAVEFVAVFDGECGGDGGGDGEDEHMCRKLCEVWLC